MLLELKSGDDVYHINPGHIAVVRFVEAGDKKRVELLIGDTWIVVDDPNRDIVFKINLELERKQE